MYWSRFYPSLKNVTARLSLPGSKELWNEFASRHGRVQRAGRHYFQPNLVLLKNKNLFISFNASEYGVWIVFNIFIWRNRKTMFQKRNFNISTTRVIFSCSKRFTTKWWSKNVMLSGARNGGWEWRESSSECFGRPIAMSRHHKRGFGYVTKQKLLSQLIPVARLSRRGNWKWGVRREWWRRCDAYHNHCRYPGQCPIRESVNSNNWRWWIIV